MFARNFPFYKNFTLGVWVRTGIATDKSSVVSFLADKLYLSTVACPVGSVLASVHSNVDNDALLTQLEANATECASKLFIGVKKEGNLFENMDKSPLL